MTQQKPTSMPPASPEQIEVDEALRIAREEAHAAADRLTQSSKEAKKTISDPKMKAVRLPTPSHLSIDPDEAEKR